MHQQILTWFNLSNLSKLKKTKLLFYFVTNLLSISYLFAQNKPPLRELRGVWIATVKNIDFPSSAKLNSEQQKKEFVDLLNFHQKNGINTVFVQVRPASDAFYVSQYAPWSEWLTGTQGKSPEPFYDPLAFMLAECRVRAMEFHAWFNPYRALADVDSSRLANYILYQQHPDWFLQYGKNLYFDPGNPEVRTYVSEVILEVVRNYDIDAVHFDDYFYPYRIQNQNFPDSLSFQKFKGNFENLDDWRRNNVDTLIQTLGESIQKIKPHIKFGISPFGVWRNIAKDSLGSKTKAGQTCYDDLYADVRKWLQKGWIDYVAPQLYWSIGYPPADYQILLDWWRKNSFGKHLYIGHGAYKIAQNADSNWFKPNQIPQQIQLNRQSPEVQGSIFFSAKSFKTNPLQINDKLQKDLYQYPALQPSMDWKKINTQTVDYQIITKNVNKQLNIHLNQTEAGYWVIYRVKGIKTNLQSIQNSANIVGIQHFSQNNFVDKTVKNRKKYTYQVQILDRFWQEKTIKTFKLKLKGKQKIKFYK